MDRFNVFRNQQAKTVSFKANPFLIDDIDKICKSLNENFKNNEIDRSNFIIAALCLILDCNDIVPIESFTSLSSFNEFVKGQLKNSQLGNKEALQSISYPFPQSVLDTNQQ